ncbi:MAG: beta strand repeat-containing protein [Pirellulales bacterium]
MMNFRTPLYAAKRFLSKRTKLGRGLVHRSARHIEPLELRSMLSASPLSSDSAWYDSAGTIDLSIRSFLASTVAQHSATQTSTYTTSYTSTTDNSETAGDDDAPNASPLVDENDQLKIRLEAQDDAGVPLTHVEVGDTFQLAVFVQDVRNPPVQPQQGVSAAYMNILYSQEFASIATSGAITYSSNFQIARSGDTSLDGQIVGAGAFSGASTGPGTAEQFLLKIAVHADAVGTLSFTSSFDTTAGHGNVLFLQDEAVAEDAIDFGILDLQVVAAGTPVISVADVTAAEGTAGTDTPYVFTVSLSEAGASEVTVAYNTAAGTATEGDDFIATSGTLTFAPGITSQLVTVLVKADALDEIDEAFTLVLSNPINSAISDGTATGTITDDDAAPTVSIGAATVITEGNAGSTQVLFTVSLSSASGKQVTVDYTTADGTAMAGSDYVARSGAVAFSPGTTTQTVTITVNGDTLDEIDETFSVNISAPVNATLGTATVQGTITDDDAEPNLSISDVTAVEGNSGTNNYVFTVTLSTASAKEVKVQYATSDVTATAGSDYTATSGTLTFSPGTSSQLVTVVVNGDINDDANETFNVTLSNPLNAGLSDATGVGTIMDDDESPMLSISDVTQVEGNSGTTALVFTATLAGSTDSTVTVQFATSDGTATDADNDYEPISGTITFAPGVTSQLVTVLVNGDLIDDADSETFTVTLSNPTNAAIADATGIGTITDDDAAPTLTISTPDAVAEGDTGTTQLVFTVNLSAASGQQVTVVYNTADDTATAGADYVATSGTLTFAPGTTSQLVTVVVNGDTLDEFDEVFALNLTSPVNATINTGSGGGTIDDDDAAPGVSLGDATVIEGTGGTTALVFTATLSAASGKVITVQYATSDDTALAGSDYTATSGTITFAPGTTSQLITVLVTADAIDEPEEAFQVTLSSPVNVDLGDATATGTITDDDAPPVLSISSVSTAEGDEGTTNFLFTLTLSAPSGKEVSVVYSTLDGGSSTEGDDYTGDTATITFAPGVTSRVITIAVLGDTDPEENETFSVLLSSPENATLNEQQDAGVGTILNDDGAHFSFSPTVVSQPEGDSGPTLFVFTVTIGEADPENTHTVAFNTVDGTATVANSDYQAQSGTLTFAPNVTSQTVTVIVNGNTTDEENETFTVVLSAPSAGSTIMSGTATGTIENDDEAPLVTIGNVTQAEGTGSPSSFVFSVSLSAASDKEITVVYNTADISASGADYTAASGTLTFAPGTTSQLVTIAVNGDVLDENDETFSVNLTAPVNATLGTASTGTGTITDDDAEPTVSVSDAIVAEGNTGTTAVVFTVTLSSASGKEVTVAYATSDGSAAAGSDYTATSGTVTFAPGATSMLLTVLANGDTVAEDDETFTLTLSTPANATLNDATGTGTLDNDDEVLIAVGNATATEVDTGATSNLVFTVTLSHTSDETVTVKYDLVAGTATAGSDYNNNSGTLTFAPGATQAFVTVVVNGDLLSEADETFTLRLFDSVNASNAQNEASAVTATGTIDDDDPLPTLTFSPATQNAAEGNSGTTPVVFTATLSAVSGQQILVTYTTADGTATTADSDYQAATGTITFAPGVTEQLITVLVNGDTKFEVDETFNVNLTRIGETVTLGNSSATATITNQDAAPTISISDASVAEGNGDPTFTNLVFTISMSAASSQQVTLNFATAPGTAATGVDFTGRTDSLTFAPGVTQQLITISVIGDLLNEPDETLSVNLSNASAGATIADGTGQGTIVNDDPLPTISINDVTQVEGDSGTTNYVFQVTLSAASGQEITVAFATANGTAVSGGDYTATSGTLTFAPGGGTTRSITVVVKGDPIIEPDEDFFVNLSNVSATATIADAQGKGTIQNGSDTLVVEPSSLAGFAIIDVDHQSDKDTGEVVFHDLTVTLTGTEQFSGEAVNLTTTTNGTGANLGGYSFSNLNPGTYTLTFSQPVGYLPGYVTVGSQGGTAGANGRSIVLTIASPGNVTGTDNNFYVWGQNLDTISARDFLASTTHGTSVSANRFAAPAATALAQAAALAASSDTFTQDGSVLTVHGTAGDDSFEFTAGASHTVRINGQTRVIDPSEITDIVFDGGGGNDSAQLTGSSGDDLANFNPGFGTLSGANYKVTVSNVNSINVNGGGGNDTGTLQDSIFDDALIAVGNEVALTSDLGQAATLLAFEQVRAITSSGGTDTALVGALDFTLEQEGSWTAV